MAATIGEQLRLAREELGIPLRQISDQTRISVRYLEAIEADDFKRLPGGIFNRSFVKAYAKCVGYDEKEAVEAYARHLRERGESGYDVATSPHHEKVYTDTPTTRSPILTVLLTILILAILTLSALAALHWYQRRDVGRDPNARSRVTTVNQGKTIRDEISQRMHSDHSLLFWSADYEKVWQ